MRSSETKNAEWLYNGMRNCFNQRGNWGQNMHELERYLKNFTVADLPFDQYELGYPTIIVYLMVQWTLRDRKKKHIATIEATPTSVLWVDQKGKVVNRSDCPYDPRIYFKRVFARDELMRKYVVVLYEDANVMRMALNL